MEYKIVEGFNNAEGRGVNALGAQGVAQIWVDGVFTDKYLAIGQTVSVGQPPKNASDAAILQNAMETAMRICGVSPDDYGVAKRRTFNTAIHLLPGVIDGYTG